MTAHFLFKPISYFHNAKDTHVVEVPTMCTTEREFFSKIKVALDMPDYFGNNWDAFFNMLCDLSWIHQYYVVLFHFDLPFVDNVKNSTYLDVLIDAIRAWEHDEGGHKLLGAFDETVKEEVRSVIKHMGMDLDFD